MRSAISDFHRMVLVPAMVYIARVPFGFMLVMVKLEISGEAGCRLRSGVKLDSILLRQ